MSRAAVRRTIKLELTQRQASALRYAIAAWFSLGEDNIGISIADSQRAQDLDKVQNDIRRQEREIMATK